MSFSPKNRWFYRHKFDSLYNTACPIIVGPGKLDTTYGTPSTICFLIRGHLLQYSAVQYIIRLFQTELKLNVT